MAVNNFILQATIKLLLPLYREVVSLKCQPTLVYYLEVRLGLTLMGLHSKARLLALPKKIKLGRWYLTNTQAYDTEVNAAVIKFYSKGH
jgi:hypothetical protein